ncbi:MAG TPA: AAA family ATPase [Rubrobacteraceae bacterium]|nr:AAA family ATPase [Rubrobacteraceae bacterium]
MTRTSTMLLLGAPRVEADGAPVEVDTRKAIALLAYLAVTGRRHTRDALAGLLWPEYGQSRARAALRRTLSSLSGAREGGWLEVDRESIGLNGEMTWVDVDRFRELLGECREHGHAEGEVCAACIDPLAEAVGLYRDDFLTGFALRDSAAFDDWQFFEAEELRRALAGALDRLSRGLAARGEWEKAISHSRRWLTLDHLHEPAHRWLMLLYAWAGERAGALRQYRECVRVLEGELGVTPLVETTRLYEAIREDDLPSPPALAEGRSPAARIASDEPSTPGEVPAVDRIRDEPLVGRQLEWETLLRAYNATEGEGNLVIIEGEAGVGKTRLSEAFIEHASREGATVLAARCYAGEGSLAYGPFVECLSAGREDLVARLADLPEHLLVEVGRLVPELADLRPGLPSPPPLEGPGTQSRFFEGICRAVGAICDGPPPGVLFIDDVHWADAASLDLLAYLTRRSRTGRQPCVLLTWRAEEVPADHRLRRLLKEKERARTATVVHLPRLDRAAVEELVGAVVGERATPEELGRRLYDETEGLPLFLAEYLAAIAKGDLGAEDEAWSLPGGVRDLLAGRLETVGESERQVLGAAAVIGRSFDFDTAREASGRGEEETIVALEELVGQGLIEEVGEDLEGSPVYDFGHEKLRALVYEEMSLARRRLLHRRVAETLARRARRRREVGPVAAQIARHYQLAGRDAEAGRYFELAGEHARSLYANVEALSHFRAALALGHPDVAGLHEAIGDLHTLLGEYGEALSSYEAAGAFGEGERLAGIERKLGDVYRRLGEWELAEGHLEAALSAPAGSVSASERARTYADLSLVAHQRDQPDLALERARRALEEADAAGDERALAQAHNVLGVLASGRGDPGEARHHLELSLTLAESLDDPVARIAALNNLALAHGNGGELEPALGRARTALDLCISLGDRHREAALHNNLADLLHAAGRREESMTHLKRAVEIFAEIGDEGELRPEIWKLVEW